jgi:hypothetical protein
MICYEAQDTHFMVMHVAEREGTQIQLMKTSDFRASITNMMYNSVRRTSVIKVLGQEKEGLAHALVEKKAFIRSH